MPHQLPIKEILFERRFKAGFMIRHEVISGKPYKSKDVVLKSAYNENGDYIGCARDAHFLCVTKGIRPEKRKRTSNVCSIGMSEHDGKWYGWSHRAIYGFQVGSKIKGKGLLPPPSKSMPVGFIAKTMADAKRMAERFAESVS